MDRRGEGHRRTLPDRGWGNLGRRLGDQLEDVSRVLAEVTGRELFSAQPLTSWAAFFAAIEEELARGPLLVALDEFQFVARQSAGVGSRINRFWRRNKDNPDLFLVLAGSDRSFFERDLMGYAATTYGRRTGSLRLARAATDGDRRASATVITCRRAGVVKLQPRRRSSVCTVRPARGRFADGGRRAATLRRCAAACHRFLRCIAQRRYTL